jgi:hypothetical protein
MPGQGGLLLYDDQISTGIPDQELAGDGETNDPTTDHADPPG